MYSERTSEPGEGLRLQRMTSVDRSQTDDQQLQHLAPAGPLAEGDLDRMNSMAIFAGMAIALPVLVLINRRKQK